MLENIQKLADTPEVEADRMTVAHILISFAGCGTSATRSRAEAEELATEVYARVADNGEDFDAVAKEHSDDGQPGNPGGPYGMHLPGKPGNDGDYARNAMVPAFGNVGWKLQVGEIGVAPHDPAASPFGWHIIKRVD